MKIWYLLLLIKRSKKCNKSGTDIIEKKKNKQKQINEPNELLRGNKYNLINNCI